MTKYNLNFEWFKNFWFNKVHKQVLIFGILTRLEKQKIIVR
jgi:hypothetical protein